MRFLTILFSVYLLILQLPLAASMRLFDDKNELTSLEPRYESLDTLVSLESIHHGECQAGIASRLHLQCGGTKPGKERMSEKERRALAISFTLCSMISASQPVPTECTYWAPGSIPQSWSAEMERYLSPCIAALRRSTQDWTSYEGYLNKASQLCLALEGKTQAEIARKAYIDLTSQSIQVFKELQDQLEKGKMDNLETQGSIHNVITELQRAMVDTFSTVSILVSHGERQDEAISQFEATIKRYSEQGAQGWKRSLEDGHEMLKGMLSRAEEDYKVQRDSMSSGMSAALANTAREHSSMVENQLRSMGDYVGGLIQKAREDSDALSLVESSRLEAANAAWSGVMNQFASMGSRVDGLTNSVSELLPAVAHSVNDALRLKTMHSDIASSISDVERASNRLHFEIADSLAAVNQTLKSLSSWRQNVALRTWWKPQGVSLFAGPSLLSVGQIQRINENKLLGPAVHIILTLVAFLANVLISTFWLVVSAMTFIWLMTAKRFKFLLDWTRVGSIFEPSLRDEEEIIDRHAGAKGPNCSRSLPRSPPAYTSLLQDDIPDANEGGLPGMTIRQARPAVTPTSARLRSATKLSPKLPPLLESINENDEARQRQERSKKPYGKLKRGIWVEPRRFNRAVSEPL